MYNELNDNKSNTFLDILGKKVIQKNVKHQKDKKQQTTFSWKNVKNTNLAKTPKINYDMYIKWYQNDNLVKN